MSQVLGDIAVHLKTLSKHGFPLQERLEKLVATGTLGGWKVAASELGVKPLVSASYYFIDLVLSRPPTILVCEVKKRANGKWLFLVEKDSKPIKALDVLDTGPLHLQDGDCPIRLSSNFPVKVFQSRYCISDAADKEDRLPILAAATDLVGACEAIRNTAEAGAGQSFRSALIPAIITNAQLLLARYDASLVDLETGEVPKDSVEIETADMVVFKTTIASSIVPPATDRSILILRAPAIPTLLPDLRVATSPDQKGWM